MNEHREHEELRRQLQSYHEPPPYPRESIEAAVMARASAYPARRRFLRVRPPAAAAAAIALFLAGILAGRAWPPSPSASPTEAPVEVGGAAPTQPVPSDYTVVWF